LSVFPTINGAVFVLLLSVSFPIKRTVISTEAAHALCEQRSGEIRFSTRTFTSHYHAVALAVASAVAFAVVSIVALAFVALERGFRWC